MPRLVAIAVCSLNDACERGRIPRVSSYTITLYWRYDRPVTPCSSLSLYSTFLAVAQLAPPLSLSLYKKTVTN